MLSSSFTRCVTKPLELFCSAIGRCLRLIFQEIPAQWQPVVMVIITLILVITTCRYRVSDPLFLKIEPSRKTPIIIRTDTKQVKFEQEMKSTPRKICRVPALPKSSSQSLKYVVPPGCHGDQSQDLLNGSSFMDSSL